MMEKIVSIVVPVYGVEDFLGECLGSIQRQTYRECEAILVDDGATDASGLICDTYAISDARTIVYHKANGGLSSARNTGIDGATGEYLYFLDSDDYIADDAIEKLVRKIRQEKADAVIFDGKAFEDDGSECKNENYYQRKKQYPTTNGIELFAELIKVGDYRSAVWLVFYRSSYLKRLSAHFMDGILHEDVPFTYRAFTGNGEISHFHETLYFRRYRDNSIQTKKDNSFEKIRSLLIIFEELLRTGVFPETEDYITDVARGIISKYAGMSLNEKVVLRNNYKAFLLTIKERSYFGDKKLKLKTKNKYIQYMYRKFTGLQNKVGGRK